MSWNLVFYSDTVEKAIMEFPAGILAHFLRFADLMAQVGPNLGMPHSRPMGNGLFELRLRGREGIARVFYCTAAERQVVVLHAFVKKTARTPLKEMRIAKARLLEVRRT
jgi:phage-related protein